MSASALHARLCPVCRPPYGTKDLEKARRATQFIGQGAPGSSTERYRKAARDLANTGRYTPSDSEWACGPCCFLLPDLPPRAF